MTPTAAPRAPQPFRIGDRTVTAGARQELEIPVARLFTGNWLSLPVSVLHGASAGPCLLLDAAIHGDELNGMEIIRRLLERLDPARLAGTVVAVPVVNVFGFVQQTRYLPDRRDLNRSFPGSAKGSMASRLAHLFMSQVVSRCQYGLDLHTGSHHRVNLPQLRGHLDDPETRRMAEAFGAPLLYQAPEPGGSLRAAARREGMHILVYEAGEPLRFDAEAIRIGVDGALRVMGALGMTDIPDLPAAAPSFVAEEMRWVRATRSGIFHATVGLGEVVRRHQELGFITTPFPGRQQAVKAPFEALVAGATANPLVHRGDALVHLARRGAAARGAR